MFRYVGRFVVLQNIAKDTRICVFNNNDTCTVEKSYSYNKFYEIGKI